MLRLWIAPHRRCIMLWLRVTSHRWSIVLRLRIIPYRSRIVMLRLRIVPYRSRIVMLWLWIISHRWSIMLWLWIVPYRSRSVVLWLRIVPCRSSVVLWLRIVTLCRSSIMLCLRPGCIMRCIINRSTMFSTGIGANCMSPRIKMLSVNTIHCCCGGVSLVNRCKLVFVCACIMLMTLLCRSRLNMSFRSIRLL